MSRLEGFDRRRFLGISLKTGLWLYFSSKGLGCVTTGFTPERLTSFLDGKDISQLVTEEELDGTKRKFDQYPVQYTNELLEKAIIRMGNISPEFASEYGQIPEVNAPIKPPPVAEGTYYICKALGNVAKKSGGIPSNLFAEDGLPAGVYKASFKWEGNSSRKTDWSGWTINMGYPPQSGMVFREESIGFEPGEDRLNYEELKRGALDWTSYSSKKDPDGLIITFKFPQNGKIGLHVGKEIFEISKSEFLSKGQIILNEKDGLEGTLTIKDFYSNIAPEITAIRDMVWAGKGDHRYSSLLQAALLGFMYGHFRKGDNPFKDYPGIVEYVKPIWSDMGDMKGQGWDDFEIVTSKLNRPELIDHYEKEVFVHKDTKTKFEGLGATRRDPEEIFYYFQNPANKGVDKGLSCGYYSTFTEYCLLKGGYNALAKGFWIDRQARRGHWTTLYEDFELAALCKDLWFILDNGLSRRVNLGIVGPFKSRSAALDFYR